MPPKTVKKSQGRPQDKFLVGAYVASKSSQQWDADDETLFFESLRQRESIRGLEHGFYGKLHRYDDDWFLANVHPDWDYSFTTLPGLSHLISVNAKTGPASKDPAGRERTIEFLFAANQAIKKLNGHHKRQSVLAVQIHSAPAGYADWESLARTLETISSWDWDGAKILIEHCDRYKADGSHKKGFLSLEGEISAIRAVNALKPKTSIGAMLNWARSVIEEQNPEHVLKHIDQLRKEGLLKAFIFSGTSASSDSPYLFYGDKHAPAPTPFEGKVLAGDSIMTSEEIGKTLAKLSLDSLDYLGVKVMALPEDPKHSLIYIDYILYLLKSLRS